MSAPLRIATRQSPLALWQARHVAMLLEAAHPGLETELVPLSTRGDQILDRSLAKVGGKGLFIKELEVALLDARADLAVHSMKDMPAEITGGLEITAVLRRADPRDALLSSGASNVADLPQGARLGTSSLRRASQLLMLRPDFVILPMRGNVQTRLAKLDAGECDAMLLATAGLERLELGARIASKLEPEVCLPAIGQGVIGVQCRSDDQRVRKWVLALHDNESGTAIAAERALGAALGGSCQSPIAGYACPDGDGWRVDARVLSPDGQYLVGGRRNFPADEAATAGVSLARQLLDEGADRLLELAAQV